MRAAPTLGMTVLEALRAAGVRELFGIPGDFVLPRGSVSQTMRRYTEGLLSFRRALWGAAPRG